MPRQHKTKVHIHEKVKAFKSLCAAAGLVDASGRVDLKRVLERLPTIYNGWQFMPVDQKQMRAGCLGVTFPESKHIELTEAVYAGVCRGEAEHCFTCAHELGHMVLHGDVVFARRAARRDSVSLTVQLEQEADSFAQSLLGHGSPANADLLRRITKCWNQWNR